MGGRSLLVHVIMLGAVLALGRMLHWPWWGVVLALTVAAVSFQFVFGRGRSAPGHLGAAAVATDDPLMVAALEQAQQTWGVFLRLYPDHRERTIVKFRFRTTSGEIENVWGDLVELRDAEASVYLRTPPVGDAVPREPRMTIPVADIVDWQIMLPDGTLRGGFTQQATFRIIERDRGRLPKKYVEQLGRYRQLEGPA
jgi:uncharacterized protein YegJ (DUF2314 family)